MNITINNRLILLLFISIVFIFISEIDVYAEVFVHDMVIVRNEKILLKAETRGKYSRRGGELVEFFMNGKSIGKTLSGGDGYAYKEFITAKAGMHKITVQSSKDKASGFLLVLNKGSKVIFIDFQEALLEGKFLQMQPRLGSQEAIKEIGKKYPLIILQSGYIKKGMIRQWLIKNGYIDLPIIEWNNGEVFNEVAQKGIIIKALIAKKEILESAKKYKPQSFSFTTSEDGEMVKDWDEIKRKLLKK